MFIVAHQDWFGEEVNLVVKRFSLALQCLPSRNGVELKADPAPVIKSNVVLEYYYY